MWVNQLITDYYLPRNPNPISLSYRGKHFDNFKLAASKVVINTTEEKLKEILKGIFIVWSVKNNTHGFLTYSDCSNLISNYRDYQNLLYQIGLLDKIGHGKYIMTQEGEKIGKGESFCKNYLSALLKLVEMKKEEDRHALLLLWFYYQIYIKTGKQPEREHFQQKVSELSAYPNIRKEVGKTVFKLLSSCLGNDKERIQDFFKKWSECSR